MAKLFPPLIEGVIPAFYFENGIVKITIPFSMNRAVSPMQVKGLVLRIKTIQSSSYLYTAQVLNSFQYNLIDNPQVEVILDINNNKDKQLIQKLKVGQFYKFQLAYIGQDNEIGHYSTVATGKYTSKPEIYINNLKIRDNNKHEYRYTGFYSQKDKDITERVYSYEFNVFDSFNKIIATSGEQLHNSSNDTELYESYDEFILSRDLNPEQTYRIQYTIKTINGLVISTPKYRISQKQIFITPEMDASLVAKLNYDDGYITLNLIKNNKYSKQLVTGSFIITRSTEDDNYSDWNEIHRFKLNSQPVPKKILWTDYTIEQGKKYQYALQQYNDTGLVSDRILSNIIYSDFEDAFLYDGERQLKIRYNPKVSNFKVGILESKVDTIGSKYPFILRNSKTYYKEFPISGLISYLMDENSLFYAVEKERNYHRDNTPNETLIVNKTLSEKIADERMFKLEVYNWLTNGKAKLFRSPTEGNYIIRLMNVSLTPNDTLGRMIHTFNSTAYEIAEYNYENLNYFGFITLQNIEIKQLQWKTIEFAKKDENNKYIYQSGIKLNDSLVETVRFIDMMPGDKIDIIFDNGSQQTIQIGVTGSYYIDIGVPIQSIVLQNNTTLTGSMVYSYYIIQPNRFNKIEDVEIIDTPVQQFIGEHDIIKEIEYIQDYDGTWLKNPKIDIVKFFYLHGFKRTSEKLKYENGKYYQDRNNQIELNPEDSDQFTIYKVGEWSNINSGYAPGRPKYDFTLQYYKDFFNNKEYNIVEENAYNPYIYINNSQVSIEDIQDYDMNKPGDLESLVCGNGVVLEVGYQTRNIDYHIEKSNLLIAKYKQDYLDKLNELQMEISNNNLNKDLNYEKQLREETKLLYQKFILTLIKAQQEERKMEGLE